MAIAAPLGLWLFRHIGVGANLAMVTVRPDVARRRAGSSFSSLSVNQP
jgi:hypothetical protein